MSRAEILQKLANAVQKLEEVQTWAGKFKGATATTVSGLNTSWHTGNASLGYETARAEIAKEITREFPNLLQAAINRLQTEVNALSAVCNLSASETSGNDDDLKRLKERLATVQKDYADTLVLLEQGTDILSHYRFMYQANDDPWRSRSDRWIQEVKKHWGPQ